MPVAGYSSSLNVFPAVSVGVGPMGYAICNPGTGFVLATTANRAGGTVDLGGIALENFVTNQQFRVCTSGYVPPEVVGSLSGSGYFVNVTSSGGLVRSTTQTSDTIGKYQTDGGVIVDLTLQIPGGTTNATSINGVAVTGTAATASWILAGDGTNLRGRRDNVYNFADFKIGGVGPDETGATDCSAHLALALATIPNYSTLYIPRPSSYYLLAPYTRTTPGAILYYDDDERGNKRGIHIVGEGGPSHEGGQYHFRCWHKKKTGSAASVTARTNGGSFNFHQTWTVDPAQGILAADKARWIGRVFVPYGCANDENNCDGLIIDVPADNTLRVANTNQSAAATDANNGAIRWWIDEPILDLRAKDITLENLGVGVIAQGSPSTAADFGAFIEFNHPPGSHANAVLRCRVLGCKFESDSRTSGRFRDGIWIARNMVATSSTSNTAWGSWNGIIANPTGLNGLGEFQVCQPSQLDTFIFDKCSFTGATRANVAFWSKTAQTKECRLDECSFGATGALPTQYGVAVPRDVRTSGAWAPDGNAHFDVYKGSFGFIRDAAIQIGGYGSAAFRIIGCYSENVTMALRANTNTSPVPIEMRDNAWNGTQTYGHRSGAHIKVNGAGPLLISGGWLLTYDGNDQHIELNATTTGSLENAFTVEDFWVHGRSDYSRRYGFRASTIRGPYDFSPSGTYSLKITSDAGTSEVSITQASMNAANFGQTVDLTCVHTWELAQWIDANFTGTTAWGDGDDSYVTIRTKTLGGTGTIQVFTPGAGTDANTKVGFPTTLDNAGAQTQLQKDTGFIDWTKAAGTTSKTHVVVRNLKRTQISGVSDIATNDINKRYNSGALGQVVVENVQGISGSNGVSPKNFGGSVSITGAVTTGTVTFSVAEDDASYRVGRLSAVVTGGAPAAGSTRAYASALGTGGFTVNLEVAPGVGNTVRVDWGIER